MGWSLGPGGGWSLGFCLLEELPDELLLPLADLVEMLVERVLADGLGSQVQVLELIELLLRPLGHGPLRRPDDDG